MSKSTFTPEKVRELSERLYHCRLSYRVDAITEWLEQNHPEPVVVGLSDKQVVELHQALSIAPPERMPKAVIKDYLRTQTFTQPEVKEVVVGLSDEQVDLLGCLLYPASKTFERARECYGYQNAIRDFLKTQTFTQQYRTDGFAEMQLEECGIEYRALKEELEQLKSQQFMPDWNTAPDWANWLAQDETGDWFYFEKKPTAGEDGWMHNNGTYESTYAFVKNWQQTLQERPQPTPKVEVGQVWRHASEGEGGDDYEVTEVVTLEGKFKIGDDWQEDVVMITYENAAQDVYRRILSDFLAKFEQVQS